MYSPLSSYVATSTNAPKSNSHIYIGLTQSIISTCKNGGDEVYRGDRVDNQALSMYISIHKSTTAI
jgi:hypothetical protein